MLLVEASSPSVGLALALLERVVARLDGAPVDWLALAPTDLDVLLLLLRRRTIGDVIRTDVVCSDSACGSRVDITFTISAFLEHHTPQPVEGLQRDDNGWLHLAGNSLAFRLPCTGDQLASALEPDPELALVQRCVRGDDISAVARNEIELALERLAPNLASELEGVCPECGATVLADFDPLHYTLRELAAQAKYIYEDVCVIAAHMHWSEQEILALPTARRLRYADVIHDRVN